MPFPNPDTQFQPGNPGRKVGTRTVASRLVQLLEQGHINGKPLGGKQVADLVAEALLKGALKGDPRLLSMLLERTEGKVADKLQVTQVDVTKLTKDELLAIVEDKSLGPAGADPAGGAGEP